MGFNLEKKRYQFMLFILGYIALSTAASKCRKLVGEKDSSRGQLSFLDCFDMGSGTLVCSVKEGVKFYVNNIQSSEIERIKSLAIEKAMSSSLSQGLSSQKATKAAEKAGNTAAKVASRQIGRIIGPILSSMCDLFETTYFGGPVLEGLLSAGGTLYGTYAGGFSGEVWLGRMGYLVGSQTGSWIGGTIGVMVYDVLNGAHFLVKSFKTRVPKGKESRKQL